jgi:formylglycine-generating enzyme required for sulfatase activity
MDWTTIGSPGNACDPQSNGCFGSVAYAYNIGTYEVTNAQYAEFLNAKAAADPLELYSLGMANPFGGIARNGSPGSYTNSAIPGREALPVNFVSFYDTLRFANWLNNGQGDGDTETGAYTLLGGTPEPTAGFAITRNPDASIFLTSEDEWYKAAYYDAASASYFDFPAGLNAPTTCSGPTSAANSANCDFAISDLTPVGSYTGSASPYGTFDQGGNVFEWNEANLGGPRRIRGGAFNDFPFALGASQRSFHQADIERENTGFRVASQIPEPATGLLVLVGFLGLPGRRRKFASL